METAAAWLARSTVAVGVRGRPQGNDIGPGHSNDAGDAQARSMTSHHPTKTAGRQSSDAGPDRESHARQVPATCHRQETEQDHQTEALRIDAARRHKREETRRIRLGSDMAKTPDGEWRPEWTPPNETKTYRRRRSCVRPPGQQRIAGLRRRVHRALLPALDQRVDYPLGLNALPSPERRPVDIEEPGRLSLGGLAGRGLEGAVGVTQLGPCHLRGVRVVLGLGVGDVAD